MRGEFSVLMDVKKWPHWAVAGLLLTVLSGCGGSPGENRSSEVEIRKPLPKFSLTQHDGESFGAAELRGRVWIGNFIFTRCGSTCPRQTRDMVRLQNDLADHARRDEIHFVSITVDPEHDTPEVLTAYAEQYKADLNHWSFLTGERKGIWGLCKNGFLLPVSPGSETDPGMLIIHSPRCVLVDRENRIRGFYEMSDPQDLRKLKAALERVLAEEKAGEK